MQIELLESEATQPGKSLLRLAPELAGPMFNFSYSAYRYSSLSLRELEAARIRTAEINGCMICQSFRAGRDLETELKASGMDVGPSVLDNGPKPDEALYTNILGWRTADNYSPREKLAIELAERLGLEPGPLPYDVEFWTRFRGAFSEAEVADITLCIAAWIAGGRVMHALGLDTVCASSPDHELIA